MYQQNVGQIALSRENALTEFHSDSCTIDDLLVHAISLVSEVILGHNGVYVTEYSVVHFASVDSASQSKTQNMQLQEGFFLSILSLLHQALLLNAKNLKRIHMMTLTTEVCCY